MTGPLDSGLDFYAAALDLRGYRQELLTADIANASTPGFKAVDLDFQAAFADAIGDGRVLPTAAPLLLLVADPGHMQPGGDRAPAPRRAIRYQVGAPVTLDGNSVDLNQEKVLAAENAVDYEAALTFTTHAISMLMTAIKGSGASSGSGGGM